MTVGVGGEGMEWVGKSWIISTIWRYGEGEVREVDEVRTESTAVKWSVFYVSS